MTDLLLVLHYLGFSVGIGGGLASLILGRLAAGAEPVARPLLGRAARLIGLSATTGLVVLWLTGIVLVQSSWTGWSMLPQLFWVKFVFVLIITGCSAAMNLTAMRAGRAGTPPPARRMAMLGATGTGAAILAVVFATIAFS